MRQPWELAWFLGCRELAGGLRLPSRGVRAVICDANSSQGRLLAKSPHCPLICTAEVKEEEPREERGWGGRFKSTRKPAPCHTRIRRRVGHMPCPRESAWAEPSPLLARFKAQEAVVSTDIWGRDLPNALQIVVPPRTLWFS